MSSFSSDLIRNPVPQNLVRALTRVSEFRGKQDLWKQQFPQVLKRLVENAVIESTVASNKIEGITAPRDRVEKVLEQGDTPRTRAEEELAGYQHVLQSIHTHHAAMQLSPNLILQLHRDLFRYTAVASGRWKSVDNQITEKTQSGETIIRFQPTPAWQTPEAMRQLHDSFERERALGEVDPILLVAAYVLDFLCIHPFLDGNGRLSRLVTLLLLYQSGYEVGKWISLEKIIQQTTEGYYASLNRSSQDWHEGTHNLIPWWEYFTGVMMIESYQTLEARVGDLKAAYGFKTKAVEAAVERLGPVFKRADVEAQLAGISSATIERAFTQMKEAGLIERVGKGRGTVWRKIFLP